MSLKIVPFDKAHRTSYWCSIVTVPILHRWSKIADLNLPHLYLRPGLGDPMGISRISSASENTVHGLSYGVICVILCFAVLVQYRRVTDGRAHDSVNRASMVSRGKNINVTYLAIKSENFVRIAVGMAFVFQNVLNLQFLEAVSHRWRYK